MFIRLAAIGCVYTRKNSREFLKKIAKSFKLSWMSQRQQQHSCNKCW